MFTKEFFRILLEFGDDWKVTHVEMDADQKELLIDVKYFGDIYEDPDTEEPSRLYDHTLPRIWRHLDTMNYKTYIRCQIPRIINEQGKVKVMKVPWAGKYDRHTILFEIAVIDLLQATKNQTKTAEFMRCSFRLVNRIIHSSSERGFDRRQIGDLEFEALSIDEKSFQQGHKYVSVLSHPRSGVILDVTENRDLASSNELIDKALTDKQKQSVKTISMDMWKAYINTAKNKLPNAQIVHDKFHLIKYLNEGIDKVRRREVKNQEELKGSRFLLLKNEVKLTDKQREKFDIIKAANFEVSKAWRVRENFRSIFDSSYSYQSAKGLLIEWATDSFMLNIKEIKPIILKILNNARGVINALISTFNNAMAERLNGKIQEIKLRGRGYRTFEKFRSAILFFHGGLDLYPLKR